MEAAFYKSDPLNKDALLCDEPLTLMPTSRYRTLKIEFGQYFDIVDASYDNIAIQNASWQMMMTLSAFHLYCAWHLYARLIELKLARSQFLDQEEHSFRTAFRAEERVLPAPVVDYLSGLGCFRAGLQGEHYVQPLVEIQSGGHFGRMTAATAILYATTPAPLMFLSRLVHEANWQAGNARAWAFPAPIQPDAVAEHDAPPPTPTRNCLGYAPIAQMRPEARFHLLSLINQAATVGQVPAVTKFLFVPAVAADVAAQLLNTPNTECSSSPTHTLCPPVAPLHAVPYCCVQTTPYTRLMPPRRRFCQRCHSR
jgi:hypothetical protein